MVFAIVPAIVGAVGVAGVASIFGYSVRCHAVLGVVIPLSPWPRVEMQARTRTVSTASCLSSAKSGIDADTWRGVSAALPTQ